MRGVDSPKSGHSSLDRLCRHDANLRSLGLQRLSRNHSMFRCPKESLGGKYLIASAIAFCAIGSVAMDAIFSGTPAHAQFTVFDPTNYSQNLLTAARSLQQINNQIQSLQNQAQMLTNQA